MFFLYKMAFKSLASFGKTLKTLQEKMGKKHRCIRNNTIISQDKILGAARQQIR